jgi:carbon-monoxide dehydrogenase small subunit
MNKIQISLTVNGVEYDLETNPNRTLLDLLREDLGLTGAKDACGGEGECGACTVLLDGEPVNSCLVLVGQTNAREVVTIEGLTQGDELNPVQQAFIESGAVQCGFCTPGAVLATTALLKRCPNPNEYEIREALSGNLCRCTGYYKMVDAVLRAAGEVQS